TLLRSSLSLIRRPLAPTLLPYTTLFRSAEALRGRDRDSYQLSVKFGMQRGPGGEFGGMDGRPEAVRNFLAYSLTRLGTDYIDIRSEEHTSELQSRENLVCRLLLEKKKKI